MPTLGRTFSFGAELRQPQRLANTIEFLVLRAIRNNTTIRRIGSVFPRLPNGRLDAARQFGLFVLAEVCYETVRGLAEGKRVEAFANAASIINFERSTGTFFEPALQSALIDQRWLVDAANFFYVNSHFVVTTAFLIWLYFYRNPNFYFVRNMFMVAMALALVGYVLVPTAPPRLIPTAGFVDTIAAYSQVKHDSALVSMFINPFAAVPSMHVCFSLLVGIPAAMLVKRRVFSVLWILYPLAVFFVVLITANHFWVDAAAGATVAVASALTANLIFARARPGAWAWRTAAA